MAKLTNFLPDEVITELDRLNGNIDGIMGEMTKAGAEEVAKNVRNGVPLQELSSHVKLSKRYKTPTDGGINTKVYFGGYLPFSGNRTTFKRRNGRSSTIYATSKGVPASFVANMFEYGRHNGNPFPKKPFFRTAFKKNQVEKAMLEVQKREFRKLGIDDE